MTWLNAPHVTPTTDIHNWKSRKAKPQQASASRSIEEYGLGHLQYESEVIVVSSRTVSTIN